MTPTGSAPAPAAGLIAGRRRPTRLSRLRTVLLRGRLISSAVPMRRDLVLEARETLVALAGALRGVEPTDPSGVALTLRLMTDTASPLYAGGALKHQAQSALEHLLAGTTLVPAPGGAAADAQTRLR